jgi:AcrR family transcriptional regulator
VGRLQDAAIELFLEQGFERTTVDEIAQRAGLSERSFFNHFADKREVLFGLPSQRQQEVVAREIAASAADVPPLDAVVRGLQTAADEVFDALREPSIRRRIVIDATPQLQEREEAKRRTLAATIATALCARGLDTDSALLTARAGVLIEQIAEERWTRPTETRSLRTLLSESRHALQAALT